MYISIVVNCSKNTDKMSNVRFISRVSSKLKALLQNNRTDVEIKIPAQLSYPLGHNNDIVCLHVSVLFCFRCEWRKGVRSKAISLLPEFING